MPERRAYESPDGDDLDLHVFARGKAANRPAILFFFGGGWTRGSPRQFFAQCEHFCEKGLVAISAQYRVSGTHEGVTPFDCVADGRAAVRFVRRNADTLGVDPSRIVASGGSAGGHVAACTAIVPPPDPQQGADSKPDALVLFNPVVDTTGVPGSLIPRERRQELSPLHHVRPGLPPTLIFHGTNDQIVPFETVELFRDRMHDAGNTCELVAFEGKAHAFFNYGVDGNTAYDETLRAADEFIAKLGRA